MFAPKNKKYGGWMMMLLLVMLMMILLVLLRNKLWKERKRNPEAKKKGLRAVYQTNCKGERRRFENAMRKDDEKCDLFKIAKRMV